LIITFFLLPDLFIKIAIFGLLYSILQVLVNLTFEFETFDLSNVLSSLPRCSYFEGDAIIMCLLGEDPDRKMPLMGTILEHFKSVVYAYVVRVFEIYLKLFFGFGLSFLGIVCIDY